MGSPPAPSMSLIVVSDLDGSLLDHHHYGYEPARPALQHLQALGVPLILSSSKTASEMLEIRRGLRLDTPFVCETAAIYLPRSGGTLAVRQDG